MHLGSTNLGSTNLGTAMRVFLARHPAVYWLAVAVLAAGVAAGVHRTLGTVEAERRRWGTERTVLVAAGDHRPGDVLATRTVTLPMAAIPPGAVDAVAAGSLSRQRIGDGEVVVTADVTPIAGPAALAAAGTLVVPVTDPLARGVANGLGVQIVAEGIVLAHAATVVGVADDVIFVAVEPAAAPLVAAAVRADTASIVYVP